MKREVSVLLHAELIRVLPSSFKYRGDVDWLLPMFSVGDQASTNSSCWIELFLAEAFELVFRSKVESMATLGRRAVAKLVD
jgi:hypothetical protein